MPSQYKQIVLNKRPTGDFEKDTFRTELVSGNKLIPNEGQALVQCTYLSLDPAMRGYVRDARSYLPPVKIGEVMRAQGLGVVLEAGPKCALKAGDHVVGPWGMREFAVMKEKDLTKIELAPGAIPLDYLSTLGLSGLTAYFGLTKIGRIEPGDKLVVSGAAGSVGTVACQYGKLMGAKVYAIAGSDDKCSWLVQECGVEKAFNYKKQEWMKDFKAVVGYLDVYFDNVGGEMLDFLLTRLNKNARIIMCGAISEYNLSTRPAGLSAYANLISQRALMQGFIIMDYVDEYNEARAALAKALGDGSIKRKFHIVEGGIEQAPIALPMLFAGGNTGKLVVKVSDDPQRVKAVL